VVEHKLMMMRCDRQNMALSVQGCAKLYTSTIALRPQPWEARFGCLACPIGAANAGHPVVTTSESTELLRTICPRCRRRAFRVIQNRLCVSCWNREREVRVGRNGKGGKPRLVLEPVVMAVVSSDAVRTIEAPMMSGMIEAMIAAARSATGPVAFGRPGASFA
jgi:Zn finger protein HypA/HybF involved in hydrogenase expression